MELMNLSCEAFLEDLAGSAPADGLTSLCAGLLILLIANPLSIAAAGLQLWWVPPVPPLATWSAA